MFAEPEGRRAGRGLAPTLGTALRSPRARSPVLLPVLWIAALGALGLAPRVARAVPVLPPGLEAHFSSLLESPLPGEWRIEGIGIEGDRVRYALQADDARAAVVLQHPDHATAGPLRAVSGHYFVSWASDSDRDGAAAFEHVVARLAASDAPSPWVERNASRSGVDQAAGHRPSRQTVYGVLAVLLVLAFAGWGWRQRGRSPWPWVVAGLAVALVVRWAWVADDAFITFRYVHHATHGHGLVFNRGERVQGFTHPAWVLLLLATSPLLGSFDAAMLCSIGCTAATLVLLVRLGRRLPMGPAAQVALVVALFSSESFVAFQTGGLETALSHLLVVALVTAAHRVSSGEDRAGGLFLLAAGLVLTRLDLSLVVFPFVAGAARDRSGGSLWSPRARGGLVLGALLVVGWLGFAALYYGFPLPNTFYAKTGEPLPLARGLRYLLDFVRHEPLASALLALGIVVCVRARLDSFADERWLRRCGQAAILSLGYVVLVGGDYMRGRFLVTPLLLSQIGLFVVLGRRGLARRGLVPLALMGALAFAFGSRAHAGATVNERAFHLHSQLARLGEGHLRPNALRAALPPEPTLGGTVMAGAFTDDPRLRWVDGYGLTDVFVARCPALPDGRAGHVERRIPRAYFEARGDVRLLEDGEARLRRGDPDLAGEVRRLREGARWPSAELEARYAEIELLTRADPFDPARLALIPRYTFTRAAIVVDDRPEVTPTYHPPP